MQGRDARLRLALEQEGLKVRKKALDVLAAAPVHKSKRRIADRHAVFRVDRVKRLLAFADQLVARGFVILGGPIGSGDDDDIALLAVEAADESAVYAVFDADPWRVHQVFRIKSVWPWTLWLDGRGG